MSTRSRIAIQNSDGTIESVYCHSDGYLEHNGLMLLEHYNSEEKARELIALGGLSVIYPKVKPDEGQAHSYDDPAADTTIAYHRDRGEPWHRNKPVKHIGEFDLAESGGELTYLWKDGQWYCRTRRNEFAPLTKDLVESRDY